MSHHERIAVDLLGWRSDDNYWYVPNDWHEDPIGRGEPTELPGPETPEFLALMKQELIRRGYSYEILYLASNDLWVVKVWRPYGPAARSEGMTENEAFVKAVLELLTK